MYLSARQEKIVNDILFDRKTAIVDNKKIVLKGMKSYLKAIKTFGPGNPVAREALTAVKELAKIHNIQDKMLLFILENIEEFDVSATEEAVLKLENLNSSTHKSYYTLFEEVDKACAEKDVDRKVRPETGINSLITNNRYKTMVLGLTNSLDDIRDYLPYDQDFWDYIKEDIIVLPTTGEGAKVQCGVGVIWSGFGAEDIISSIKVIVPKVVDYETAMEAIRVYKRAYDLYLCIGKTRAELPVTNANEEQMKYRENIENLANRRFR